MKTINEGNIYWKPWWVGEKITCSICSREVELEQDDEKLTNWMPIDTTNWVEFSCEKCGNLVHLERNDYHKTNEEDNIKEASLDSDKKWTKGQLCKYLEDEAKLYLKDVKNNIKRNRHMHKFRGKKVDINLVEAVLVGYINSIALGQGLDLGLYTHYLHEDK